MNGGESADVRGGEGVMGNIHRTSVCQMFLTNFVTRVIGDQWGYPKQAFHIHTARAFAIQAGSVAKSVPSF